MAINFLSQINALATLNLNQTQLFKAQIENQINNTGAGTGVEGQLYFDTTLDVLKVWAGGAWAEVGGGVISLSRANSTFINLVDSGTASNPILTASLSATGTAGSTTFLKGTNTWATAVTSINVSGGTTGLTTSGGAITTAGTITLAGTLNAVSGGTGQSTYTVGDILYASSTTTLSKLAIGAAGQVLKVAAGLPSWSADSQGVTSVAQTHAGNAFGVTGSPITGAGTLGITMAGNGTQYINGLGNLITFPTIPTVGDGQINGATSGFGQGRSGGGCQHGLRAGRKHLQERPAFATRHRQVGGRRNQVDGRACGRNVTRNKRCRTGNRDVHRAGRPLDVDLVGAGSARKCAIRQRKRCHRCAEFKVECSVCVGHIDGRAGHAAVRIKCYGRVNARGFFNDAVVELCALCVDLRASNECRTADVYARLGGEIKAKENTCRAIGRAGATGRIEHKVVDSTRALDASVEEDGVRCARLDANFLPTGVDGVAKDTAHAWVFECLRLFVHIGCHCAIAELIGHGNNLLALPLCKRQQPRPTAVEHPCDGSCGDWVGRTATN